MNTSPPRAPTPRWVKLFGLVAALLIAALLAMHLSGVGLGPGMHGH